MVGRSCRLGVACRSVTAGRHDATDCVKSHAVSQHGKPYIVFSNFNHSVIRDSMYGLFSRILI